VKNREDRMIEIGATNEMSWTVGREHLASAFGSGLVDVLATPVLVGFCEECARTMVDPRLPSGQKTVGTSIRLEHLAATPLGMRVTVSAKLVEVDRRRLRFEIDARDEVEPVGRGTHERFIIDADRFELRLRQKTKETQDTSSRAPGDAA
jgi:fluoroacetyl-CoA thioesterase